MNNECMGRLKNGIITENPVFIMALGLCPTFAVTTNATNAIGMGLSSMAVLIFSNLIISLMRNIIPDRVRLPAEIVVVASLVTIVQLLMQGFAPAVYKSLGIYIPLIVVNCIILGRAEAYALKAKPLPALFDGIGMGLGFTLALLLLGSFREILGSGSWFGVKLIPEDFHIGIFVLPPGAFFVMSWLIAAQQYMMNKAADKEKAAEEAAKKAAKEKEEAEKAAKIEAAKKAAEARKAAAEAAKAADAVKEAEK